MTIVITFDGPKGVGKTTLIEHIVKRLQNLNKNVRNLVEKDLMEITLKNKLEVAYKKLKIDPGYAAEKTTLTLYIEGRINISKKYLHESDAEIILLDRWYPSDTVFRRHINVSDIIEANMIAGVFVPNITFAITCDPATSWERALKRERKLDSKIINTFEDHVNSTIRFESAAKTNNWHLLNSEITSAEILSQKAIEVILSAMK